MCVSPLHIVEKYENHGIWILIPIFLCVFRLFFGVLPKLADSTKKTDTEASTIKQVF